MSQSDWPDDDAGEQQHQRELELQQQIIEEQQELIRVLTRSVELLDAAIKKLKEATT